MRRHRGGAGCGTRGHGSQPCTRAALGLPPGLIRSRPVRQPLKAKAGTPRGAPKGAGRFFASCAQGPVRTRVARGASPGKLRVYLWARAFSARHPPRLEGEERDQNTGDPPRPHQTGGSAALASALSFSDKQRTWAREDAARSVRQPKSDASDFGQLNRWPNSGRPEFGCGSGGPGLPRQCV